MDMMGMFVSQSSCTIACVNIHGGRQLQQNIHALHIIIGDIKEKTQPIK